MQSRRRIYRTGSKIPITCSEAQSLPSSEHVRGTPTMMGSGKVFSSKASPATKEMGDPAARQVPCALSSQAGASSGSATAAAAGVGEPPPTTEPSPDRPPSNPKQLSPAARFRTARRSIQTGLPPPGEAAVPSFATSRPLATRTLSPALAPLALLPLSILTAAPAAGKVATGTAFPVACSSHGAPLQLPSGPGRQAADRISPRAPAGNCSGCTAAAAAVLVASRTAPCSAAESSNRASSNVGECGRGGTVSDSTIGSIRRLPWRVFNCRARPIPMPASRLKGCVWMPPLPAQKVRMRPGSGAPYRSRRPRAPAGGLGLPALLLGMPSIGGRLGAAVGLLVLGRRSFGAAALAVAPIAAASRAPQPSVPSDSRTWEGALAAVFFLSRPSAAVSRSDPGISTATWPGFEAISSRSIIRRTGQRTQMGKGGEPGSPALGLAIPACTAAPLPQSSLSLQTWLELGEGARSAASLLATTAETAALSCAAATSLNGVTGDNPGAVGARTCEANLGHSLYSRLSNKVGSDEAADTKVAGPTPKRRASVGINKRCESLFGNICSGCKICSRLRFCMGSKIEPWKPPSPT
ncbi:hypothetical protein Vretifemale_14462 [Volvox reticuliferus]|uniref:Uncharacterized protein n=1 Tax=Volvox reticuliferus TaxID=1737510 RepID=A0A8J4CVA9_9CHLO|nr:hypothetical protein Vretifemale_14462 [Volvox reticuliferus]